MLVIDRFSGLMWDYYLTDRKQTTILQALKHFFGFLRRQFSIKPKILECDNENILMRPEARKWLQQCKMKNM